MRKLSGYGPSLIVLAAAMVVLFVGPSAVKQLTYRQTRARMVQAAHRLDGGNILAELNQAYRDIADFVEPSVVHISAQQPVPGRNGLTTISTGSGWVYDEAGHVITNYHVVQNAQRIEVQLSSNELREAKMIGFDRSTDIAVIQVATGRLHAAVRAPVDQEVRRGDLVFAFGSPFDFRFSMSSGIVSGKGRSVDVLGPMGYENFIQVDAAINPGNSGGPLTDHQGHVIGMNTAIATGKRSGLEEGQFAGIGLAIPLEMIEPVVTQIIEKGVVEKGYLGVSIEAINVAAAQVLGLPGEGVLVSRVEPTGPAAEAGVEARDIITAVNGNPVSNSAQLRSHISSMLPGQTATLTIWRPSLEEATGRELEVDVRLTRLPLRASGELPPDQSTERLVELGIARMSTSTPALAERFETTFQPGVLIERAVPGSRLARFAGPGTLITDVRGEPITSVEELYEQLRQHNLRVGVRIGFLQPDGEYMSTVLYVDP